MARIRKRGDTYSIGVSNGYCNGKQLMTYETYKPTATTPAAIKKELEREAVRFEREVKEGKYLSGEKTRFKDFAALWRDNWAAVNLTQSQYEQYWKTLEKHVFPEVGSMYISKITAMKCQSIIDDMVKIGYAPKTVRRMVTCFNSVMKYAYKKNVIQENVLNRCDLPKNKETEGLHFFTPAQVRIFLDSLENKYEFKYGERKRKNNSGKPYTVSNYKACHTVGTQWKAYFYLAIYGGFRRGEMVALTWEDIDFEENTVSINKAVALTKEKGVIEKSTKTKAGRRCIPLPAECFEVLKEWKKEEKELSKEMGTAWNGKKGICFEQSYVFIQDDGSRMHPSTPSHKFKELVKLHNESIKGKINKAETKEERESLRREMLPVIRLHDLRHSMATALIAAGDDIVDVSHRMGHSKPSVTLDVYSHYMKEKDTAAVNSLSKAFGSNTGIEKEYKSIEQTEETEAVRVLN